MIARAFVLCGFVARFQSQHSVSEAISGIVED